MATAKTTTLTFRIGPELKETLRIAPPEGEPFYYQYGGGTDPRLLPATGY